MAPSSSCALLKSVLCSGESGDPAVSLNPANLKRLYAVLVSLSLNGDVRFQSKEEEDLCVVSDSLFQQLHSRFMAFRNSLQSKDDDFVAIDQLALLLRCCLTSLLLIATRLDHHQHYLIQRGQTLLSVLRSLISLSAELSSSDGSTAAFENLVSRECTFLGVDADITASVTHQFVASTRCLDPSHPLHASLCALLEVFADELLAHKSLRDYFMLFDSSSARSNMLFACHCGRGDIACVLELLSAHFILSVSDAPAFENFLSRLYWCQGEDFRVPEISLPAALSLLLNPVLLSAPKMFQAYFIALASETIGICSPLEYTRTDLGLMDCYAAAFRWSVVLYARNVSSFVSDECPLGFNGSFVNSCLLGGSSNQLTFESFLQPATRDKIYHLIAKSSEYWDSHFRDMSFGEDIDLVATSVLYVKENLFIFDESYRDEVLSIFTCIILRVSSANISDTSLHNEGERSPQDTYLLASILKLMSSALLQTVPRVRYLRSSGFLNPSKDVPCGEYDEIMDIISRFEQFSISQPIQKFLFEAMQSHPVRHTKSQWMFLHISGLLELIYGSRHHVLVKACLFALMTLLNLFIVEEGGLSALGSYCKYRHESPSPSDRFRGARVVRKSSQTVSSKMLKIQEMYLRTHSMACITNGEEENHNGILELESLLDGIDSAVSMVDSKETCDGEIFLECIQSMRGQRSQKASKTDDLVDFIECRRGKDYAGWLRDRRRFRQWKCKKTTTLRWKKKRKCWNSLKGSR